MSVELPTGQRGLALPLIAENAAIALVEGNSATSLALTTGSVDPRPALTAGRSYYVEVVSGPFEGERIDLDLAATLGGDGKILALRLGAGSSSTLGSLNVDTLAGARCVVRPHVTLSSLQTMVSPSLVGRSRGATDGVQLFEGGGFVRYHLNADGATWSRPGNSTADYRNLVIAPDTSVIVELSSGAKRWTQAGVVRTNAFRKNLVAGEQSFASGFPQDLSFVDAGGFVDPSAPAASRWTGAAKQENADWFERRGVSTTMPFNRYFLREDGTTWQRVNKTTNVAHERLLDATDMFVLRRLKSDAGYVIPVPFVL